MENNYENQNKEEQNTNLNQTTENLNQQNNNSQNNFNQNLNKEAKPIVVEESSNTQLIFYILLVVAVFIIILLLLRGCNGLRNKNKSEISETNEWITNMWNKCVDPIYWYTVDGTGINGAEIDIDSVLNDCDTYYNEYKDKKGKITSLSDDYADFKEIYSKISEQIEIIYPKIKADKPVAQENVDYEENIEALHQYQVELYNLIQEKYSKG